MYRSRSIGAIIKLRIVIVSQFDDNQLFLYKLFLEKHQTKLIKVDLV